METPRTPYVPPATQAPAAPAPAAAPIIPLVGDDRHILASVHLTRGSGGFDDPTYTD